MDRAGILKVVSRKPGSGDRVGVGGAYRAGCRQDRGDLEEREGRTREREGRTVHSSGARLAQVDSSPANSPVL